jgi:hypothetical protein
LTIAIIAVLSSPLWVKRRRRPTELGPIRSKPRSVWADDEGGK